MTDPIPTPRTDAAEVPVVDEAMEQYAHAVPADLARRLERELAVAEEALRKVAADSEAETGWGPDVTTLGYIKEAIRRLASMRQKGAKP